MKALRMVLTFLFVFVSAFAQETKIQSVNNWKLNSFHGASMDSIQTKTVLVDSAQKYGVYGTPKMLGVWLIEASWVKPLDQLIADTLAVKIKVAQKSSNVSAIWFSIAIQDSLGQFFTGYEVLVDLRSSDWQTFKFDMNKTVKKFMKRFMKVYLYFSVVSTESSYVGADIEVKDLLGIDREFGTIVYDNFQSSVTRVFAYVQNPKGFALEQNYPNPFNPSTTIKFTIPKRDYVNLTVYNLAGQEVKTLVSEEKTVGSYEVRFDASSLPSGIYFYRLKTSSFAEMKKMIFIK